MSREIKFKYFYGEDEKPNTIFTASYSLHDIEAGCVYEAISDNPLYKNYRVQVVCQFTGLTDKNGVEIYERDFVKVHEFVDRGDGFLDDVIMFCLMIDGSWQLTDCDPYHEEKELLHYLAEDVEVIGNQYENPELLEATS